MTQQDEVRLIRKLIFAKNSQDLTHFYRCVDEIAEVLNKQGDKEGARAIRNTSRDGYVKSYYEASRQTQPLGSPFVSYKPAFVIDNKDIVACKKRQSANASSTHFRVCRKRGDGRKRCAGIRCKHR